MNVLKAVIDTNILVSILKGSPHLSTIYTSFKEDKFHLILSSELLKELSAVLYRPRLKIDNQDIKELFRIIKTKAIRIKLPDPFIDICRDTKDNFILEAAVTAGADVIVTGDKDLLIIKKINKITIITPKEFIQRLKSK